MKFQIKKDGLSGDTLKFAEVMEAALDTAFNDATKGVLTEEGLTAKLDDYFKGKGLSEEEKKSISDTAEAVRKQAAEIDKLKSKGINAEDDNSLIKQLEAKKDRFKEIKRQGAGFEEFVYKVPAVTTTATITNSITAATGRRLGDAAVSEIMRGAPFILDFVNVGNTTSSILIWFDEVAKDGDFAITAEGAVKPMIQYKFERKSTDYKKAAGYTVLTDEFDRDFPQLVTTIKRLMQIDCRNKINDLVLADIIAAAPTYTYTGLNAAINNADNFAAIAAAYVQAKNLYFNPNVLILNPADEMLMNFQKDANGQWVMSPFNGNGVYRFDAIYSDPRVAAGNFILGDLTRYNVDLYGDVIVRIGYVNDDLIRNQYTVVVEQYFYSYIKTNDRGGIVYGNFATIKAALETP